MKPIRQFESFSGQVKRENSRLDRLPFCLESEDIDGLLARRGDRVFLLSETEGDHVLMERETRGAGLRYLLGPERTVHASDGETARALDPRGVIRDYPFPVDEDLKNVRRETEESLALLEKIRSDSVRGSLVEIPFENLETAKRVLQPLAPALPGPAGTATLAALMMEQAAGRLKGPIARALAPVLAQEFASSDHPRYRTLAKVLEQDPRLTQGAAQLGRTEAESLAFIDVQEAYGGPDGWALAHRLLAELPPEGLPPLARRLESEGLWTQKVQRDYLSKIRGGSVLHEGQHLTFGGAEGERIARAVLAEAASQPGDEARKALLAELAGLEEGSLAVKCALALVSEDGTDMQRIVAGLNYLSPASQKKVYPHLRPALEPQEAALVDVFQKSEVETCLASVIARVSPAYRRERGEFDHSDPGQHALLAALEMVKPESQKELIPSLVVALGVNRRNWDCRGLLQAVVTREELINSKELKNLVEGCLRDHLRGGTAGLEELVEGALARSGSAAVGVLQAAARVLEEGLPDSIFKPAHQAWSLQQQTNPNRGSGLVAFLNGLFNPEPTDFRRPREARFYGLLAEAHQETPLQLQSNFKIYRSLSFAKTEEDGFLRAAYRIGNTLKPEVAERFWDGLTDCFTAETLPALRLLRLLKEKGLSENQLFAHFKDFPRGDEFFTHLLLSGLQATPPTERDSLWAEALECYGLTLSQGEEQLFSKPPEPTADWETFHQAWQTYRSRRLEQKVYEVADIEFSEDHIEVGDQVLAVG